MLNSKNLVQHSVPEDVTLGILGKERFHYWRLLVWTGSRRHEPLSVPIALATWVSFLRRLRKPQGKGARVSFCQRG